MQKRRTRVMALLLSATLLTGQMPAAATEAAGNPAVQATEEAGKILSLSFDDEETGFAGSGGKAAASGTNVLSEDAVRGKSLSLDGTGSNILSLTKEDGSSLLTGCEEFTVSYWSKVDEKIDPNWSVWISKNDNHPANDMNYIGVLDRGYQIRTERYLTSRTFDMTADTVQGEWKLVTVVFNRDKTTIYLNGQKAKEKEGSYSITEILGNESRFYIGKANWGTEYFKGLIDEFEVYNYALTQDTISEMYACAQGKILSLSFDDGTNGFRWGNAVAEQKSDVEGKAVELADGYNGKALKLNAQDKTYLNVTAGDGESLLTGCKELTISYWSKTKDGVWTAFAEPEEGGTTYQNEKYVGICDNGSSVKAERFYNGRPAKDPNAAVTENEWKFVTVVLKEAETELYINGEKVSSAASDNALTDILGTNSHFYIGKASWGEGEYFTGLIDDYSIYNYALNDTQIQNLYLGREADDDGTLETEEQQRLFDSLTLGSVLPDQAVLSNAKIDLPAQVQGANVSWKSNQEQVIAKDGTVTLPKEDTVVKLTAMIEKDGVKLLKDFMVPVIAEKNRNAYFQENFIVPSVVADGMKLKAVFGGQNVTWQGSCVDTTGKITAGESEQEVTLTAALSDTGIKKEFKVKVLAKGSIELAAYTRVPKTTDTYSEKLAYSMHLAYSKDGVQYTQLNGNSGILFAKATINSGADKPGRVNAKNLKNPYLFYRKDGSYGIVAVRTDSDSETMCNQADDESRGKVLLFTTKDFVRYEEVGLIDLKADAAVSDVTCDYDSSQEKYVIRWCDTAGNYYKNTMTDVTALDSTSVPEQGGILAYEEKTVEAEGACERNAICVPKEIGDYVLSKLTRIHNTGVEVPEQITASSAKEAAGTKVTLTYSDGSFAQKGVDWDFSGVDFSKAGEEYQIKGTVKTAPSMKVNVSPMAEQRADPNVFYRDGYYYFIATDDAAAQTKNGYMINSVFYIRKSETIEGLKDAKDIDILNLDDYEDLNTMLWAPEIHVIDGETYIFFSTTPGSGWNVQSHVMHLKKGGDMTKKSDWEKPVRFLNKNGQPLNTEGIGGITLDMTTFEVNGHQYVMWSQRNFGNETGAWVYIGEVDKKEPWKLISDAVVVAQPDYGWDNNAKTPVDEGPYAIITKKADGTVDKVFVTFSGSAVGATYCVGLLEVKDVNGSLLDAGNWMKWNYPIVDASSVEGECGPGHNSYTTDADGNLVFVYHARPVRADGSVGTRNTGLRTVHFDAEGYPVLYMTTDLELANENRTVSTTLKVTKSQEELQREEENKKAAENVEALIKAIGTVSNTQTVKNRLAAARAAYEKLTEEQKKLVSNYAALTRAETEYKALEGQKENGNHEDNGDVKPVVKKGDTCRIGNYKYQVTSADADGKGTVKVTGVTKTGIKQLRIPAVIKYEGITFRVTEIGTAAFKNCKKATSAVIGKNVQTIRGKAFWGCKKLKKLTVSTSVLKKVEKNAFKGIHAKAKIKVPAKKYKKYKKLLHGKGQKSSVRITK